MKKVETPIRILNDTNDTNVVDTADTNDDDTGEEVVDPFADLEDLNGKIIIPSLFEGRLIPRAAFWHQVGNKTLVYMTANQSATCELAANHLNPNETAQDPSDLFILDHCNMGVVLNDSSDLSQATYFSECTFGSGSFSQQGSEWQWTGTDADGVDAEYFEAFGTDGNTTDLQIEGDRLAVEVAVTDWSGIFPYSNTYNTSVAVGTGSGYIIAQTVRLLPIQSTCLNSVKTETESTQEQRGTTLSTFPCSHHCSFVSDGSFIQLSHEITH